MTTSKWVDAAAAAHLRLHVEVELLCESYDLSLIPHQESDNTWVFSFYQNKFCSKQSSVEKFLCLKDWFKAAIIKLFLKSF